MGTKGAMTIRVTTPSTSNGGGTTNAQFTYINHGADYAPGWRRDWNRAGDTMTGGLTFENDSVLAWFRNTDWAKIGFKNDGDSDTDSFMWFETGDNGNEYFKWRHKINGGSANDWMTLKSDALRVAGSVIAGSRKGLAIGTSNNSTLNAKFRLWGNSSRPTVVELADDTGWHLYSQRNTDNSVTFAVNGQVIPGNYGNFDARYQARGQWVQDNRLGGEIYTARESLGHESFVWHTASGYVCTGFKVYSKGGAQDEFSGMYSRPVQKLINGTWYNVVSV